MSTAKWSNEFKFRKVLVAAPQDCWPWIAGKIEKRYGIFNLGELTTKKSTPAYVAAWFFYVEQNLDFDGQFRFSHLCGDPLCVNPAHLIKLGPKGLENDRTVLEFIANKNPTVRNELLRVAARLLELG
jgi:hypothetical protein